ncbi:hypothetical protein [Noviherbaspirillum sp.]|uniref:hypothetical protein n=1 Tax=Noviherbaspirillum sp. TaxID=1926288 RepID=UPI002FE337D8
MQTLLIILGIVLASVAALITCFFGISWLIKLFGQEKVERYTKLQVQGPFVPMPKKDGDKEASPHE